MSYPLFRPPAGVPNKPAQEWSEGESRTYFEWLTSACDSRVAQLLTWLGLDDSPPEVSLLETAGRIAAEKLKTPEFSSRQDGRVSLTNAGYALAADMGLLTAVLLLRRTQIRWSRVKRPKNHVAYNLPVLVGFGPMELDPVGGSVAEANGIISGVRDGGVWGRIYRAWASKAEAAPA